MEFLYLCIYLLHLLGEFTWPLPLTCEEDHASLVR